MMKQNLLLSIAVGFIAIMPMKTHAQEAYAALSDDNTTLTFYYDNKKSSRNGMDIGPFDNEKVRGWYDNKSSITKVVFDPSFANKTDITSTAFCILGLGKVYLPDNIPFK